MTEPRFSPRTGQSVARFDPYTGQPVPTPVSETEPSVRFNPYTGEPEPFAPADSSTEESDSVQGAAPRSPINRPAITSTDTSTPPGAPVPPAKPSLKSRLKRLLSTPEGKVGAVCASVLVLVVLVGGVIGLTSNGSSSASTSASASNSASAAPVRPCQTISDLGSKMVDTISAHLDGSLNLGRTAIYLSNDNLMINQFLQDNAALMDSYPGVRASVEEMHYMAQYSINQIFNRSARVIDFEYSRTGISKSTTLAVSGLGSSC